MGHILTPTEVRKTIWRYLIGDRQQLILEEINPKKKGLTLGKIAEAVKQENRTDTQRNRRLVCGWLLTPDDQPLVIIPGKEITPKQANALHRWIFAQDEFGNWEVRKTFQAEACWVLNWARVAIMQTGVRARTQTGELTTMSEHLQFIKKYGADFNDFPDLVSSLSLIGGLPSDNKHEFALTKWSAAVADFSGTGTHVAEENESELDLSDIMPL